MKVSKESFLTPSFSVTSIFLLLTIFTTAIICQTPDCTREVFINGDTSYTSADSTSLTTNIDLTGEISLGETICFYAKPELNEDIYENYGVDIEGEYDDSYPLVYVLNLTQVTRTYSLRDQYTFAKPSLSVYCVCDCPGGSDHCTDETDYCASSPGPICVNVLVDTLGTGCPLAFLSGAPTCCSVTVSPSEDYNRYIAYRLADSETVFHFTLSSTYTSDGTLSEPLRQITAVMNGDSTTNEDDESEISITANKMDALDIPTSNLYSNEIGGEIMWDVEVNVIDERNFHKLGWFRITDSTVGVGDTERLKDVVSVNVTNCIEDEYTVTFNVSYDKNDIKPWGSPLHTLAGEHVTSSVYNPLGPSASVNYQVSPRITFELPLLTSAEYFYQSGESRLDDFSLERTEGDSTLTMTFTGTSGIISGNVQSGSESNGYNILHDVSFMVPTSLSDEVTIRLTLLSTTERITRVCLHHILNPSDILCKNAPLEVTTMKIPPLSPKVPQTMYHTDQTTITQVHINSSQESGNNNAIEENSEISLGNGKNSDKTKNLKWYIITFAVVSSFIAWVI